MHRIAAPLIVIGLSLAAGPAAAQFGNLFGDGPPRPPADVPGDQPSSPGYQGQPPPSYPQANPGQQAYPGSPPQGYQGQYPGQPRQGYQGQYPGQGGQGYQGQYPGQGQGYQGQYPGQGGQGYQGQYPGRPAPGSPAQAYPGQPPGAPAPSPSVEQQALPPPPGGAVSPQPVQPADRGYPPPGDQQPNPAQPADRGYPQPPGRGATPPQGNAQSPPAAGQPSTNDDTVVEKPTAHITNKRAVFVGLDKITGRTIKFDAALGETVQFGALQVTPRACYTRPPTEATNTDAFVEVDEVTLKGDLKRIFTGWMFAPSPGLNAVEHPIFDVWLIDCASPVETAEQSAPPPAAPRRPPSRRHEPAPADDVDAPQPD